MVRTPTTKEIVINVTVGRVVMETQVVDVPFSKCIMEKLAEVLSGLFLKYVIEM